MPHWKRCLRLMISGFNSLSDFILFLLHHSVALVLTLVEDIRGLWILLECGFLYFGFQNERSVVVVTLYFEREG